MLNLAGFNAYLTLETDKCHMVPSQVEKVDNLTLEYYTWLETSLQTTQCESLGCSFTSIVVFSYIFTEVSKNI